MNFHPEYELTYLINSWGVRYAGNHRPKFATQLDKYS